MTASNRASKIDALYKSLKKHFKPVPEVSERSVLEQLLYACCLEDARFDQADEAFAKLQQTYFDWNEVRVTTTSELGQCLQSLPHASQAAMRIKQCLQSLFEARYQYEIDDLKKANLGKAVAELEAWKGISPFVVSYVSQQALGGHSIPISNSIVESLMQCEIITPAEADKKSVPGLERAIPKNKGSEFGSLLLQFAVELQSHPKSNPVQSVLKDLGVTYKAKPKVEAKTEVKTTGTAKSTADGSKTAAAAKAKVTDKAEPILPTTKKTDGKKAVVETAKTDKHSPKPAEKKDAGAKSGAKPITTKKMAPPSGKQQASVKGSTPPKKKETRPEPPKKQSPKKPEKKESKSKPVSKSKPIDTKNKKVSDAKAKKQGGASKTSSGSGSVSSSLTKKKPK